MSGDAANTAVASSGGGGGGGFDIMSVLNMAGKGPLKKVAYQVLEWVQGQVGQKDQPVPGNARKQESSPKQFMDYFKDGNALVGLVNKFAPGTIPEQPEDKKGTKEGAIENIRGFLNFAEKDVEVPQAQQVKAEDVQAGKTSAFSGLLQTLVGMGGKATEKFGQSAEGGLNMDSINQMATQYTGKSIMEHLMALKDRLFKRTPAVTNQAEGAKPASAPAEVQAAPPETQATA